MPPTPQANPAYRLVLTVRCERLAGQGEVWLSSARVGVMLCASYGPTRESARDHAVVRALRAIAAAIECGTRPAPAGIDIVDAPESEGH